MEGMFGVRHEYGLLRDDRPTQHETRPPEEGTIFNMGWGMTTGRGFC